MSNDVLPKIELITMGVGVKILTVMSPELSWRATQAAFKAKWPHIQFKFNGRYANEHNCTAEWVYEDPLNPNPMRFLDETGRLDFERQALDEIRKVDPAVNHITFEWYTKRVYVEEGSV